MKSKHLSRIWLIYIGLFLVAAMLMTKLFLVQVVHGEAYAEKADRQYIAPAGASLDRGSIFFTEKNGNLVSAATVKTGYIIAINPTQIKDASLVYEQLSKLIDIDLESFFFRAGKTDDPYEEIINHVDAETAEKIKDLELDGVLVVRDKWRFYPAGRLAAHLLGFMGYQENVLAGRYGLERYYEDTLARDSDSLYVNFFAEIFSDVSATIENNGKNREGDVITSIEPNVQGTLEQELEKLMDAWDADFAGGIIIDPRDGQIYALAAKPDFDSNTFQSETNSKVFINPLVENVFEMGSIIKPLTMAAGLDAGVVTPNTTYDDKGYLILNGARISNFDGKGRGVVPMQEVLNQSLNTGVSFVVSKLGKDKFRNYMYAYGIGEETGIDLPNETAGLVSNLESTRDIEYATASFGQGIALTPIETVRALSVLANGGKLVTPHIARKIDYRTGFSKDVTFPDNTQVISEKTSDTITQMLVKVVDDALLDGTVKLDNYSIAAKTGTAQVAKEDGRGYYEDRYLHSFFGYFPAYEPRFLVFLYVSNPKGVRYASHTLTYPFMDITKFLLNYYDIPPDR